MPELLTRFLPASNIKSSTAARSLNFPFSSTRPVTRYAWFDDSLPEGSSHIFDEVLSHDAKAWNLERVTAGVCPFLKNHNRDLKLGTVNHVEFKGDRAFASVQLRRTKEADDLLLDLEDGTAGGVSFGYSVQKYRVVTPAKFDLDGTLTQKALLEGIELTLYEVSAEEMPADPTVGFGKSCNRPMSLRSIIVAGDPNWQPSPKVSPQEQSMQIARLNYEQSWRKKEESRKSSMGPAANYENAWQRDRGI